MIPNVEVKISQFCDAYEWWCKDNCHLIISRKETGTKPKRNIILIQGLVM